MNYAINEIFYSIQGEGIRAGTANVFVRFQGCNLTCSQLTDGFDCDTEFESGQRMTTSELMVAMDEAMYGTRKEKMCVLTGGEPLQQVDTSLLDALHADGWYVAIETNGTRPIPEGIDWVCVSPKTALHTLMAEECNEFKLVRHDKQMLPVKTLPTDYKLVSPAFSPDGVSRADLKWCMELVKLNPDWRLSCQQHKWWNVR